MIVYYLSLALGAGLAVLSAVKEGLSWALLWRAPLLLLGAVAGVFLLYVAVAGLFSLSIDMKKKYETPSAFCLALIRFSFSYGLALCGVRLSGEGLDRVPEGSWILVANHRSGFDPLLLTVALWREKLVFISKPENFRIPIIRRFMHRCCHIAIDRENPRNAITSINEAARLIETDAASVGVFPEGTRSKTGALGEFKAGCFKIAQKAKCPVVVAVIRGSDRVAKELLRRGKRVTVSVAAVLPTAEILTKRTGEISDEVRAVIQGRLEDQGVSALGA